jgi:putative ABC transport system substrate-binding protein
MIARRRVIAGIAASAGWTAAGYGALGQTPDRHATISWFSPRSAQTERDRTAFRLALAKAGYYEGRNLTISDHWADGDYDRLPAMAADLVASKPAVIVTTGGPRTVRAIRNVDKAVPLVFSSGTDPVADGLVESLARPGGATTGVFVRTTTLGPKRLQLLREIAPSAERVGFLINPSSDIAGIQAEEMKAVTDRTTIQLRVYRAGTPAELDRAFAAMSEDGIHALLMSADSFFQVRREQIVALAARHALPTMFEYPEFVRAGGLASYAVSLGEVWGQMGSYVARILDGTRPADLPIVQPATSELAINLRTARLLGVAIPTALLARADEVIE